MTFTAIDFETANKVKTSACQIGIIVVENGKIIKEFSSYIKPPEPDYFLKEFTDNIHGITKEMVKNAPTFKELWETISGYIINTPVIVAHNAHFDFGVLNSLLDFYDIKTNLPTVYCTLRAARKYLPRLENHQLSTVSKHFNIQLNHHEALSDARAAANIALEFKVR
ncbi:DNA polymerase III [Thiospirochaeta perfilievii]|uniref:DNA polymerase III n=1 Tax=Thiospirochaeta perfilievii TaxID=252967 RepID=A0A5C1Q9J6_9SPIO|nr:3'-5' exonuclease [Thiospirochaeta perfilievii]QEN03314.1 DNA polymerase III [Thiospirochaeta perfilievii]